MKYPVRKLLLLLLTLAPAAAPAAETIPVQTVDGTEVRVFSAVPAPGVHPRILISPDDLPGLRRAVAESPARKGHYATLRKMVADTLDNPAKPEGRVLAAVAAGGAPTDAQFAAASALSQHLALAGLDALLAEDAARGALLARTLSLLGEYQLRAWVRQPDPVGLHNSFDPQLCLAYDFIAPWMTEAQRAPVRRHIARMIDGIDLFTHDWPAHMRMWNWSGLHVYQGWGSLAIEGEEGWNPHLWNQARVIIRDFFSYNIHPSGALTEDITYFSFAMRGAGPAAVAMARRGDLDLLGRGSNLRHLRNHLVNQLHPWGGGFMSHQDGAGDGFYAMWPILKYLYPTDPALDYAYRNRVGPDYMKGVGGNDGDIRPWANVLFGTEFFPTPVTPAEQNLPLTYFCPTRGYLIARSAWNDDALKLDFEAKTDYPTVGHNHADANNFTLAALGREWATELGYHAAAGHLHNNILIDGRSQSPWPMPGGRWVDLVDTPEATIGVSDASHAYSWRWTNSGWGVKNDPPPDDTKWELETLPEVREFVRAQVESGKGRQSIFEHHGPILRAEWNPVEKAYRTAALVRGANPYVLIVDDIRKDAAVRLYEWAMFLPEDVELLRSGPRWVVLGARELPADPKAKDTKRAPDTRRLLVQVVDVDVPSARDGLAIRLESTPVTNDAFSGNNKLRTRLVIPARTAEPRFKILLYPHREGDPLPDVLWNAENTAADFVLPGQTDRWTFAPAAGGRTALALAREGRTLATVRLAPAAPVFASTERLFTGRALIAFHLPHPGQEIRYTLDGTEPSASSSHYAGPFWIDASATVKAATFARDWPFAPERRSAITEATFTRAAPREAVAPGATEPGLRADVYRGFWNELPDFAPLAPEFVAAAETFSLPPATPGKGFGVVFTGYLRVPADGVYTFATRSDDASRLWIGDQLVVDNDGAHVVRTRSGEIALRAGLHPIRVAHCDMALALGTGKGDGSWAFEVLWAPQGSAVAPIRADSLVRAAGLRPTAPRPEKIASAAPVAVVPGLVYSAYDRTATLGQAAFFDTPAESLRWRQAASTVRAPDSAPGVLHVYEGFLTVPHAGVYEFSLPVAGLAEFALGGVVVGRVGAGEANLSRAAELPAGLVPFTLKLGRYPDALRWRGPGMDWQAVTGLVRADVPVPSARRLDLLGHWSADRLTEQRMVNLAEGGAGSLAIPAGTPVVDDPAVGRALRLQDAAPVRLQPTGILANALTVSLRLKAEKNATLFRYGYAHTGIFAEIRDGDLLVGGGRIFNVARTGGRKLADGQWHTVTFTFGGEPVRTMRIYFDGELQAEGRSPSPCLTDSLDFLGGFTGDLADIRLFNRVLSPEEIAALAAGKTPAPSAP